MNNLSNLQKKIIEDLLSYEPLKKEGLVLFAAFLESYYFNDTTGLSIRIENTTKRVGLYIRKTEENYNEYRQKNITFFLELFTLLNNLKKDQLIFTFGDRDSNDYILGKAYEEMVYFPQDVYDLVVSVFLSHILISQDLLIYSKNKYLKIEDIRHKQTMIVSFVAICFSILLGLFSIILSIYQLDNRKSEYIMDQIKTNLDKIIMDNKLNSNNTNQLLNSILRNNEKYLNNIYENQKECIKNIEIIKDEK